jgi:hypothetical protein
MQNQQKPATRKKFLLSGAILLVTAPLLKFFSGNKTKKKYTVRMLTQDGRLVEVNREHLASKPEKISDEQLKNWVKNKNSAP